jgi:hypothetical protein
MRRSDNITIQIYTFGYLGTQKNATSNIGNKPFQRISRVHRTKIMTLNTGNGDLGKKSYLRKAKEGRAQLDI